MITIITQMHGITPAFVNLLKFYENTQKIYFRSVDERAKGNKAVSYIANVLKVQNADDMPDACHNTRLKDSERLVLETPLPIDHFLSSS